MRNFLLLTLVTGFVGTATNLFGSAASTLPVASPIVVPVISPVISPLVSPVVSPVTSPEPSTCATPTAPSLYLKREMSTLIDFKGDLVKVSAVWKPALLTWVVTFKPKSPGTGSLILTEKYQCQANHLYFGKQTLKGSYVIREDRGAIFFDPADRYSQVKRVLNVSADPVSSSLSPQDIYLAFHTNGTLGTTEDNSELIVSYPKFKCLTRFKKIFDTANYTWQNSPPGHPSIFRISRRYECPTKASGAPAVGKVDYRYDSEATYDLLPSGMWDIFPFAAHSVGRTIRNVTVPVAGGAFSSTAYEDSFAHESQTMGGSHVPIYRLHQIYKVDNFNPTYSQVTLDDERDLSKVTHFEHTYEPASTNPINASLIRTGQSSVRLSSIDLYAGYCSTRRATLINFENGVKVLPTAWPACR